MIFVLARFVLISLIIVDYHVNGVFATCPPLPPRKGIQFTCRNPKTRFSFNCQQASTIPTGTIAEFKCAKYYAKVHLIEDLPSSTTLKCTESSTWSHLADLKKFSCQPDCGRVPDTQTLRPLIIDGKHTNATLWPWHATIYNSGMYSCGGTLVNAFNHGLVVLSAAHCFFDSGNEPISKKALHIVLGAQSSDFRVNELDRNAQIFRVERILPHERYQEDPSNFANDIAIVKLDGTVQLTDTVSPVCLSASEDLAEEQLVIGSKGETVGFGHSEPRQGTFQVSPVLVHAVLPVVQRRKCQEWRHSALSTQEICAGYPKGTAVCKGDSGGGLVFSQDGESKTRYYIQGIVSHGYVRNSAQCESYGVFTRINSHVKWILEQVRRMRISIDQYEVETETPTACPSCEPVPTLCPKASCVRPDGPLVAFDASTAATTRRSIPLYTFATTNTTPYYIRTTTTHRPVTTSSTSTVATSPSVLHSPFENIPPYQKLGLQIHNQFRNLHSAPPLQLNEMLSEEARKYAEKLVRDGTFVNKNDPSYTSETLPFLKNIFQIRETGGSIPIAQKVSQAVTSWYIGIKHYNWNVPQASTFSQVVWKSTTDLGLGYATGHQNSALRTVIVAAYAPPGNIIGKNNHEKNVFPKT